MRRMPLTCTIHLEARISRREGVCWWIGEWISPWTSQCTFQKRRLWSRRWKKPKWRRKRRRKWSSHSSLHPSPFPFHQSRAVRHRSQLRLFQRIYLRFSPTLFFRLSYKNVYFSYGSYYCSLRNEGNQTEYQNGPKIWMAFLIHSSVFLSPDPIESPWRFSLITLAAASWSPTPLITPRRISCMHVCWRNNS